MGSRFLSNRDLGLHLLSSNPLPPFGRPTRPCYRVEHAQKWKELERQFPRAIIHVWAWGESLDLNYGPTSIKEHNVSIWTLARQIDEMGQGRECVWIFSNTSTPNRVLLKRRFGQFS